MRTNITYIALTALVLAGCVRESLPTDTPLEGIIINLELEEPQTKATRDGDASLNENVVASTIDLFFYNESTLEITKEVLGALRTGTLVQIQTNPNDIEDIFGTRGAGAHCGIFVVANFTGTYNGTPGSRTLTEIQSSLLPAPNWESFPQGTPAGGFVAQTSFVMTGQKQITLGNAQGSTPVSETVSLARIAAKVTFDVTVAGTVAGEESTWTPDLSNMSVYMVYAMRKATLGAEPVDMPVNANVTYTVNNASETVVFSQYRDKVLYDTGTTIQRRRGNTTVNAPVYSTTYEGASRPFYAYPCAWETGSAMEPYMKLIIPWTYGNTTRKYYYKIPFHGNELERNHWYHISIDVQILGTEQADPPEVTVNYAIAPWSGTMDTATAEEITSVTSVPAEVIMTRYLSVPTTEYVLYNEDKLVIPIQSSHDIEIVGYEVASGAYTSSHYVEANYIGSDPRIYNPFSTTFNSSDKIVAVRPDYGSSTPSAVSHEFTFDQAADAQGWSVVADRLSITLIHELNRDLSSANYDVAPYTIRMRVRHQGEGSTLYFADVTVEQRPSIIIRPYENSGGNSNYGYAFVNGAQNNGSTYGSNWTRTGRQNNYTYYSTDGSWTGYPHYNSQNNSPSTWDNWTYYLGSAPSTVSESNNNANTNMYVIETSVLPDSGNLSNYMLGDPRERTIDNLSGGNTEWSQSKPAVIGENRRITYYYPAGGSEYDNFIAPKLRVASSYGATYLVTFENAKRRCAAYQEDGLPAGRWRLPTVAEIEYISLLNTDGKIFRLLGSQSRYTSQNQDDPTSDYWCNSGFMTVYNGTNSQWSENGNRVPSPVRGTQFSSTDTKYIRCVYDEWYWEKTTHATVTKSSFTWGDQNRDDVRKN